MTTVFEPTTNNDPGPEYAPGKFPTEPYASASAYCGDYFQEIVRASASIDLTQVDRAAALLIDAIGQDKAIFSCGNGGSAAISNHFLCDHLKGIRTRTDIRPRITSLSTGTELITAIANDIGYEEVFAFQLQSHARAGNVLMAISSSGASPNIVRALDWAREHDLRTIALTGFDGGAARAMAEVSIHVQSTNYGVIEDLHQAVVHSLAQYVRQSRMSAGTVASTTF
jgi:phosphoheptose isomerase